MIIGWDWNLSLELDSSVFVSFWISDLLALCSDLVLVCLHFGFSLKFGRVDFFFHFPTKFPYVLTFALSSRFLMQFPSGRPLNFSPYSPYMHPMTCPFKFLSKFFVDVSVPVLSATTIGVLCWYGFMSKCCCHVFSFSSPPKMKNSETSSKKWPAL